MTESLKSWKFSRGEIKIVDLFEKQAKSKTAKATFWSKGWWGTRNAVRNLPVRSRWFACRTDWWWLPRRHDPMNYRSRDWSIIFRSRHPRARPRSRRNWKWRSAPFARFCARSWSILPLSSRKRSSALMGRNCWWKAKVGLVSAIWSTDYTYICLSWVCPFSFLTFNICNIYIHISLSSLFIQNNILRSISSLLKYFSMF